MMAGNITTSMISTFLRAANGIASAPAAIKPEQTLQLYDIENCPYCRLVREALTELDLDAEIYPCPKSGERFRPELVERGGKAQFPYLVDRNTGTELYESLDIIDYLFTTYGQRELPGKWRVGKLISRWAVRDHRQWWAASGEANRKVGPAYQGGPALLQKDIS